MTKREYYDLLVKSASDGTFPSGAPMDCRYRDDGTPGCPKRCAIGLLIPDEKYVEEMEGRNMLVLGHSYPNAVTMPDGLTVEDLGSVQRLHDFAFDDGDWLSDEFLAGLDKLPCFQDFARS